MFFSRESPKQQPLLARPLLHQPLPNGGMRAPSALQPGLQPLLSALPAAQASTALALNTALGLGLLVTGKYSGSLTKAGLAHSYALGVLLWATLGPAGWAACVLYLVAGSIVTKVRLAEKQARGIAEARGGARGPENVWGSAATAAACALGTALLPGAAPLLRVGFVSSLATKLSDTFASEIGKAYGKSTYLVTTLKPVPPGTEGAVSLEGTAAGVIGSLILAGFGVAAGLVSAATVVPCLIAAFVATTFESLLGATTQGRLPWLTNEFINFVNTAVGAALAMVLVVAAAAAGLGG
ncbi:unnamed protein product [Phaeothamnion confervicola]